MPIKRFKGEIEMIRKMSAMLLLAGSFAFGGAVSAANMTMTGEVSDALCGTKHMMKDSAMCTMACAKKGSGYALVVKDKVYTLKADDKASAELDKLAGKMAIVTGDMSGTTMTVTAVKMAPAK
jgi:hypothetical protein